MVFAALLGFVTSNVLSKESTRAAIPPNHPDEQCSLAGRAGWTQSGRAYLGRMEASWSDPRHVLDVVERLLSASRPHLLHQFSAELGKLIPHRAAAMQTGDCPRSPLKVVGDQAIADAVTSVELQWLVDRSEPGKALVVDGVLGGVERRIVLLSAMPAVGKGAVLAVVPEDTA